MQHSTGPTAGVRREIPKIMESPLDFIGETPMIRCRKLEKEYGLSCNLLVKCEYYNAGGSVKDRIGKRMVEDAEKSGRIKPGDTLIEPTSGNTGIGIALAAAIKGYRCIITLPEKMSNEKVYVLKALGAEIVRTPTEAAWDSPDSHISVAKRLNLEIPNSHILDQYANPSNPLAHYDGTAVEILAQCDGQVDMLVASAGTGGTISGIAAKLKQSCPAVEIVGVDPVGSILAVPDSLNEAHRLESYLVEGIGYDFIPDVLDRGLVDTWMKSTDRESLLTMRKMIRQEGLLCGGSCGAAMSCALVAAKKLSAGQNCVVILPDSVRNYMTKALSDDWMLDNGFVDGEIIKTKQYEAWWSMKRVCDIPLRTPLTIQSDVTCAAAIALLKQEGFDMVPVVDEVKGSILGVVTEGALTTKLLSGRATPTCPVTKVVYKTFKKVAMNDTLSSLAATFDHEPFALVVTEQRLVSPSGSTTKTIISGIVTRIDLLDYISKGEAL